MVAVVNGSGLGLYNSLLATRGGAGNATQSQNGERVYVNSATGNLVIQNQDEALAAIGIDLGLIRTYNSQGLMNDDNGDNWRLSVYRKVHGLTGTLNAAGSTITKTFGDGADVVYTYNTTSLSYISDVGEGAVDTLTYSAGTWTWRDGSGRNTETYDATGVLRTESDADGNTSTYTYVGNLLTQIVDGSGQTTSLEYTGNNLERIRIVPPGGGSGQVLTTYGYDSKNRLTSVTVDLTPANSSDNVTYVTTYTYWDDSTRVRTITQSDGTAVEFTYQLLNGEYRLKTYKDGENRVSTFDYTLTSAVPGTGAWATAALLEASATAATDPLVQFDSSGNGFAIWAQGNSVFWSRYTQANNSWSTAAELDDLSGATNTVSLPSLAVDSAGNALAAWVQLDAGGVASLYARRYDANSGWSAVTPLEASPNAVSTTAGHLSVGINLSVAAVAWVQSDGTRNNLYGARLSGTTWTSPALLESRTNAPSAPEVAIDSSGNVSVIWLQSDGTANSIYHNRYQVGSGWAASGTQIDALTAAAADPQIAFDSFGNGFAVWIQNTTDLMWSRFTRTGTTGTWSAPLMLDSLTAAANTVTVPKLSVDAAGNALAAWVQNDNTTTSLFTRRYDAATGAWGSPTLVEGTNNAVATAANSVTVSINGNWAAAAWVQSDGTRNNLYGSRLINGVWTTPTLVESSNNAPAQASVAIDSQGNISVVWRQSNGANSIFRNRFTGGSPNVDQTRYLQTTVTDQLNQVTTYKHDSAGRLESVITPGAIETRYAYDAYGNIISVREDVTGLDRTTTFAYAPPASPLARGNLLTSRDALGNTVSRTYNAANQLLTETLYLLPDADAIGGTQSPSVPLTTRYVYDETGSPATNAHLRFVISPQGRVTEYRYSQSSVAGAPKGALIATLTYHDADYIDIPYAESDLTAWLGLGGRDLTKTDRVNYEYDFRGNISAITAYTAATSAGAGAGVESVTRFVYDQRGQLLQKISPLGSATAPNATSPNPNQAYATTYTYDGLGRLKNTTEWLDNGSGSGRTRSTDTNYDDVNHRIVTTLHNIDNVDRSLVTTSVYNLAGDLTSVVGSGATSGVLSSVTYSYDAAGRLRFTTDSNGIRQHVLYDIDGRKVADVDGNGTLTEYVYNATNQVIKTTRYATAVDPLTIANVAGQLQNTTLTDLRNVANTDPSNNQITRSVYDATGRVVYGINDIGAVTQFFYDGANRVTDTIEYSAPVSIAATVGELRAVPAQLSLATAGATRTFNNTSGASVGSITANTTIDRRSRSFYDNDGKLTGTLDAGGYLQEFSYDKAGFLVKQKSYATKILDANLNASTLAELLAQSDTAITDESPEQDIESYFFYDGQGRQIATLDGEGNLVETVYDTASRVVETIRYGRHDVDGDVLSLNGLLYQANDTLTLLRGRLPVGAVNHTTRYQYDGAGRLVRTIDALTRLAGATNDLDVELSRSDFRRDDANNVLQTTNTEFGADERVSRARYDEFGRVVQELSAQNSARITGAMNQTQIDQVWTEFATRYAYDASGRRASMTVIAKDETLAGATPVPLTSFYYYNADGQMTYTVNAQGQVSRNHYNALGQMVGSTSYATPIGAAGLLQLAAPPVNASESVLIGLNLVVTNAKDAFASLDYLYVSDPLIRRQLTTTGAEGAQTIEQYDVFGQLAKKFTRIKHTGVTTTEHVESNYTYDRRGLNLSIALDSASIASQTSTFEYDAFGRVKSVTDQYGNRVRNQYDRIGRVLVSIDELGNRQRTEYDAFSRVTATYDSYSERTEYRYDDTLNTVVLVTPELVRITTKSNRYGQTVSVTDGRPTAMGQANTTVYSYNKDGQLVSVTDDASATPIEQRAYDSAGRQVTATDGNGVLTRFAYDAASRTLSRTVDMGAGNPALVTSYSYDDANRTMEVTEVNGSKTRTEYDRTGRVMDVIVDYGAAGHLNLRTHYDYDDTNNTIQVTEGVGGINTTLRITQYVFDKLGRRTQQTVLMQGTAPQDLVTQYKYDRNGNVTRKIDGENKSTWFVYNEKQQLRLTIDAMGGITENIYDSEGRVSRTIRYATPVAPGTLAAYGDSVTMFTPVGHAEDRSELSLYDRDGRNTFTVDAARNITKRDFDANGNVVRTTKLSSPLPVNSNPTTAAQMDSAIAYYSLSTPATDRVIWTVYDKRDKAVYSIDGLGAVTRNDYDNAGNVTKTTAYAAQIGGVSGGLVVANGSQPNMSATELTEANLNVWANSGAVQADPQNRVSKFWYDAANRQRFELDAEGYLTETRYNDASQQEITKAYANKQLALVAATNADTQSIALGIAGTGGVAISLNVQSDQATLTQHDLAGRTTGVQNADLKWEYFTYDAVGNKKTYTNLKGDVWNYEYDANGRLLEERTTLVDVTTVTRDVNGVLSTNVNPDLVSIVTRMTYDNLGNVKTRQEGITRIESGPLVIIGESASRTTTYGYDALGRQTTVTFPEVDVYDVATDTTTTRSDLHSEVTYDALGNATRNIDVAGGVSYKVYDRLGRVVYEIDALRYITRRFYDAFGNEIALTRYDQPLNSVTSLFDATTKRIHESALNTAAETLGLSQQTRTIDKQYDRLNRLQRAVEQSVSIYDTNAGVGAPPVSYLARPTTVFAYNAFGEVVRESHLIHGQAGIDTVDPTINSDAWAHTYSYYNGRGLLVAQVDAENYLTRYEYADASGDFTQKTEFAKRLATVTLNQYPATPPIADSESGLDRITRYGYDTLNRLVLETKVGVAYQDANGMTNTRDLETAYGYDVLGNQTRIAVRNIDVTDAQAANAWINTYNYYDSLGRLIAVARPTHDRGDGVILTPLTTLARDVFGNVVKQVEHANGGSGVSEAGFTVAADPNGLNRSTLLLSDLQGAIVQSQDAAGGQRLMKYNARRELAFESQEVTNVGDGTIDTLLIKRKYDLLGREISVVRPQSATQSSETITRYNGFGEADRKGVVSDNFAGGDQEHFDYDRAGRIWRSNAGDGTYKVYLYDLMGHVTAELKNGFQTGPDLSVPYLTADGANASAGLLRTVTVYDKLGRAIEQRAPTYDAPSPTSQINGLGIETNLATGVRYLSWLFPADGSIDFELLVTINGVQVSKRADVQVLGEEFGYRAVLNLSGAEYDGVHAYELTYRRVGATDIVGRATGTISKLQATVLSINPTPTDPASTVGAVVPVAGGILQWTAPVTDVTATLHLVRNGDGAIQDPTVTFSDSGDVRTFTANVATLAAGTWTYTINHSREGVVVGAASGTISSSGSSTPRSVSGANSSPAAGLTQPVAVMTVSATPNGSLVNLSWAAPSNSNARASITLSNGQTISNIAPSGGLFTATGVNFASSGTYTYTITETLYGQTAATATGSVNYTLPYTTAALTINPVVDPASTIGTVTVAGGTTLTWSQTLAGAAQGYSLQSTITLVQNGVTYGSTPAVTFGDAGGVRTFSVNLSALPAGSTGTGNVWTYTINTVANGNVIGSATGTLNSSGPSVQRNVSGANVSGTSTPPTPVPVGTPSASLSGGVTTLTWTGPSDVAVTATIEIKPQGTSTWGAPVAVSHSGTTFSVGVSTAPDAYDYRIVESRNGQPEVVATGTLTVTASSVTTNLGISVSAVDAGGPVGVLSITGGSTLSWTASLNGTESGYDLTATIQLVGSSTLDPTVTYVDNASTRTFSVTLPTNLSQGTWTYTINHIRDGDVIGAATGAIYSTGQGSNRVVSGATVSGVTTPPAATGVSGVTAANTGSAVNVHWALDPDTRVTAAIQFSTDNVNWGTSYAASRVGGEFQRDGIALAGTPSGTTYYYRITHSALGQTLVTATGSLSVTSAYNTSSTTLTSPVQNTWIPVNPLGVTGAATPQAGYSSSQSSTPQCVIERNEFDEEIGRTYSWSGSNVVNASWRDLGGQTGTVYINYNTLAHSDSYGSVASSPGVWSPARSATGTGGTISWTDDTQSPSGYPAGGIGSINYILVYDAGGNLVSDSRVNSVPNTRLAFTAPGDTAYLAQIRYKSVSTSTWGPLIDMPRVGPEFVLNRANLPSDTYDFEIVQYTLSGETPQNTSTRSGQFVVSGSGATVAGQTSLTPPCLTTVIQSGSTLQWNGATGGASISVIIRNGSNQVVATPTVSSLGSNNYSVSLDGLATGGYTYEIRYNGGTQLLGTGSTYITTTVTNYPATATPTGGPTNTTYAILNVSASAQASNVSRLVWNDPSGPATTLELRINGVVQTVQSSGGTGRYFDFTADGSINTPYQITYRRTSDGTIYAQGNGNFVYSASTTPTNSVLSISTPTTASYPSGVAGISTPTNLGNGVMYLSDSAIASSTVRVRHRVYSPGTQDNNPGNNVLWSGWTTATANGGGFNYSFNALADGNYEYEVQYLFSGQNPYRRSLGFVALSRTNNAGTSSASAPSNTTYPITNVIPTTTTNASRLSWNDPSGPAMTLELRVNGVVQTVQSSGGTGRYFDFTANGTNLSHSYQITYRRNDNNTVYAQGSGTYGYTASTSGVNSAIAVNSQTAAYPSVPGVTTPTDSGVGTGEIYFSNSAPGGTIVQVRTRVLGANGVYDNSTTWGPWGDAVVNGGGFKYSLNALIDGTTYEYEVQYVTSGTVTRRGIGTVTVVHTPHAAVVTAGTTTDHTEFPIINVTTTAASPTTSRITWNDPTAPNGTTARLEFYVNGVLQATQSSGGSGRYFDFTANGNGLAYTYEIRYLRNDNNTLHAQGSGTFGYTATTSLVPTTLSGITQSPVYPSVPGVTNPQDLGAGEMGWSDGAQAGESVQVRYRQFGSGTWLPPTWAAATTNGASGYKFNFNSVTPQLTGTIEFEIRYINGTTISRYGAGSISITREASYNHANTTSIPAVATTPTTSQAYDRWNNIIRTTDASIQTVHYFYNQNNQVIERWDPTVDAVINVTAVPTSGIGVITEEANVTPTWFNYYDIYGNAVGVRDANGNLNRATYNLLGERIAETRADGGIQSYAFNAFGEVIEITDAELYRTWNAYDQMGNLVGIAQEIEHGGLAGVATGAQNSLPFFKAANVVVKSYGYDGAGRRISETSGEGMDCYNFTFSSGDPNVAETTRYWYDNHGNVIKSRTAGGTITSYAFDAKGHQIYKIDANEKSMAWTYDYFGHVLTQTDMAGTIYTYDYDDGRSGLLESQTSSNNGPNGGQIKTYYYDGANHLIRVDDDGIDRVTEYAYDNANRVNRTRTTLRGLLHEDTRTEFDELGRISNINGIGFSVTYTYDRVGNRTHILGRYSTFTNETSRNFSTQDLWYAYDTMNRVTVTQGVRAEFGGAERVTMRIAPEGGNPAQGALMLYDLRGNRISSESVGAGFGGALGVLHTDYGYDGLGRLKQATVLDESGVASQVVDARTYDRASRIISQFTQTPDSSGYIGRSSSIEYTNDGQMALQTTYRLGVNAGPTIESRAFFGSGEQEFGGESGYDATGTLKHYEVQYYKPNGSYHFTRFHDYTLRESDKYQEASHTTWDSFGGADDGATYYSYDRNGEMTQFVDAQDPNRTRDFANNIQGQVLTVVMGGPGFGTIDTRFAEVLANSHGLFNTASAGHFFFNAQGQSIGSFAFLDGALKANFDVNYTPISASYPGTTPSSYVVQTGDTLRTAAAKIFGDSSLWYILAEANGLSDPDAPLPTNTNLIVPNNVTSLPNTANSFKPFDVRDAIGDTTPTQPMPEPKDGACGLVGRIIITIITIIVSYYCGPIIGNLVMQMLNNVFGYQDGFSWKSFALSVVMSYLGPVFNALGEVVTTAATSTMGAANAAIAGAVVSNVAQNVVSQGLGIAMGLQDSFSWKDVAISGAAAAAGEWAGQKTTLRNEDGSILKDAKGNYSRPYYVSSAVASGMTSMALNFAFRGKEDARTVLADGFANLVGNSIVAAIRPVAVPVKRTTNKITASVDLQEVVVTARRLPETDEQIDQILAKNPGGKIRGSLPTPDEMSEGGSDSSSSDSRSPGEKEHEELSGGGAPSQWSAEKKLYDSKVKVKGKHWTTDVDENGEAIKAKNGKIIRDENGEPVKDKNGKVMREEQETRVRTKDISKVTPRKDRPAARAETEVNMDITLGKTDPWFESHPDPITWGDPENGFGIVLRSATDADGSAKLTKEGLIVQASGTSVTELQLAKKAFDIEGVGKGDIAVRAVTDLALKGKVAAAYGNVGIEGEFKAEGVLLQAKGTFETIEKDLGLIKVSASGEGALNAVAIGGSGALALGYDDGRVRLRLKAGASLFIGGQVGFDLNVDARPLVAAGKQTVQNAVKAIQTTTTTLRKIYNIWDKTH